jgi:hypothetical protein
MVGNSQSSWANKELLDMLLGMHVIFALTMGLAALLFPSVFSLFLSDGKVVGPTGDVIRLYGALILGQTGITAATKSSADIVLKEVNFSPTIQTLLTIPFPRLLQRVASAYAIVFLTSGTCSGLSHFRPDCPWNAFNLLNVGTFWALGLCYAVLSFNLNQARVSKLN